MAAPTGHPMFELIRITTVHPALVHLPLGILFLAVVLYVIAAARHSERWTFAADVAAWFGAATALLAGIFGFVSYYTVEWPGGLEPWPQLHLGMGVATVVLSAAFALTRAWRRRKSPVVGAGWAAGAVALGLVAAFTGYVGGEVLVFHAGMAVQGAARGSLAPSLSWPGSPPEDVEDAMGRLRGAFAAASTTHQHILVEHPTEEQFREVARAAGHMQEVARWLEQQHESEDEQAPHGAEAGTGGSGGEHENHAHLARMAGPLLDASRALEEAAQAHDVPGMSHALGDTMAACASCHTHLRWKASGESGEHP